MAGAIVLTALLMSAFVGHAVSGMAYPGVGAPVLPEGPVRKLVIADLVFLAVCGLLWMLGI